MKVKHIIEALQQLDQEAEVYLHQDEFDRFYQVTKVNPERRAYRVRDGDNLGGMLPVGRFPYESFPGLPPENRESITIIVIE